VLRLSKIYCAPPLVELQIVNAAAFRIGVAMVPDFVQVVL
jgi:hypothetical protein